MVGTAGGLALADGLGDVEDLGMLLVSLRISVPRMGATSDGVGW